MKKFINFIIVAMLMFVATNAVAQNNNYTRNGNQFESVKKSKTKSEPVKTDFTWKDSKDISYPIYISDNGSCYIIRTSSKTGKEYRNYLGTEISKEVCKALGREYKGKIKKS